MGRRPRGRIRYCLATGLLALLLAACRGPAADPPRGTPDPAAIGAGTPTAARADGTATRAATAMALTSPTPVPAASGTSTPARPVPGQRQIDFGVDFGDFTSTARLYLPAGHGPFPTVLILAGSGPDSVDSYSYRDLIRALVGRGYATVHYTKHYVYGPSWSGYAGNEIDNIRAYMLQVPETQLLADAERVYRAVVARPEVDAERLILYGQSQGGSIATQLALAHPGSAGLILHGAAAFDAERHGHYITFEYTPAFLREIVDSDRDGALTLAELVAAEEEWAWGSFARLFAFLLKRTTPDGSPRLNAAIDTDRDGRLQIDREIRAAYEAAADDDNNAIPGRGPDTALPAVHATITGYRGPILVQHGARDGFVNPADAVTIDAALLASAHPDHLAIIYPTLGHALGDAPSRYGDLVSPPTHHALGDLLTWLDDRFRPAPPR